MLTESKLAYVYCNFKVSGWSRQRACMASHMSIAILFKERIDYFVVVNIAVVFLVVVPCYTPQSLLLFVLQVHSSVLVAVGRLLSGQTDRSRPMATSTHPPSSEEEGGCDRHLERDSLGWVCRWCVGTCACVCETYMCVIWITTRPDRCHCAGQC